MNYSFSTEIRALEEKLDRVEATRELVTLEFEKISKVKTCYDNKAEDLRKQITFLEDRINARAE